MERVNKFHVVEIIIQFIVRDRLLLPKALFHNHIDAAYRKKEKDQGQDTQRDFGHSVHPPYLKTAIPGMHEAAKDAAFEPCRFETQK
jgi:hypothetical protein